MRIVSISLTSLFILSVVFFSGCANETANLRGLNATQAEKIAVLEGKINAAQLELALPGRHHRDLGHGEHAVRQEEDGDHEDFEADGTHRHILSRGAGPAGREAGGQALGGNQGHRRRRRLVRHRQRPVIRHCGNRWIRAAAGR